MLIQPLVLTALLPPALACGSARTPIEMATPPLTTAITTEPIPAASGDEFGEVRVVVHGLRNHKGQVLFSLFASADGFPDNGDSARERRAVAIEADPVELTFSRVPPGTHAVAVLHDEDKDFKMKTGTFGIPKEGYGVSNNARGRFGPPKFDDAKFEVTAGAAVTVRIELIYH